MNEVSFKENKNRATRNRTITLSESERLRFNQQLLRIQGSIKLEQILDKTICQDIFEVLDILPTFSIDLVFADPPYNLNKSFNDISFEQKPLAEYEKWLESWLPKLTRIIKPTGSLYICGDWRSSAAIHRVIQKYFIVRNRITWEREKGRGAKRNWKNCSEDIWYCTRTENYYFNVDKVKLKRRVLAPYTHSDGKPKDWLETDKGKFRETYPSNIWTDLTVPFWSMPENSDHPTQKPEKLLAKIILSSSKEGDVVFDPFLGSGTTSVVAKKLNRRFIGVEIDEMYCCLAEKRLNTVTNDRNIQGYSSGFFWERNTLTHQNKLSTNKKERSGLDTEQSSLF